MCVIPGELEVEFNPCDAIEKYEFILGINFVLLMNLNGIACCLLFDPHRFSCSVLYPNLPHSMISPGVLSILHFQNWISRSCPFARRPSPVIACLWTLWGERRTRRSYAHCCRRLERIACGGSMPAPSCRSAHAVRSFCAPCASSAAQASRPAHGCASASSMSANG